jgi:cytochrome c-type biogenesis protein CcmH
MKIFYSILLSFSLLIASTAQAGIEVRTFANPEQEALYDQLMYELRCLVCQNENLAASNAELAQDLRNEVYAMITAKNMDEAAIKDFLVQRYGDFVLYKPPLKKSTFLLWTGPFLLLLLGFVILFFVLRHNRQQPTAHLDKNTRDEMKKLLETNDKQENK